MSRTLPGTPAADGFRMPGEFEPHRGTWMLWPERTDNWRWGAKPAQAAFVEVARAISRQERVTMCVSPAQFPNARRLLPDAVRVVEMTSNDAWVRDCGPSFLVNAEGEVRGVDWKFNAWGGLESGLYFPWDQDDLVGHKILEIEDVPRYAAPIVLEGGSIEVDGEGTLLATRECLLNHDRNPGLSPDELEARLAEYLGVSKIVWLERGVYNDETEGHIDNLARFARPGLVLLDWTDDRDDPQYAISLDAFERLSRATDARGRPLEVVKLPQPGPLYMTADEALGVDVVEGTQPRTAGLRLAASYVNFYCCNGAVIMPLLDERSDAQAAAILAQAFPRRQVVGVPAREILLGGGDVHCITQQQPRGRVA
ncbi:MAG TPA: agmatine deiminase [Arenimonas sp.]|nr:MAG: agmatine deiminase [Xanthomonadales bacterium GWF1_69_6]HBD19045.1 agmatine deiminase [Arenimonas sp.]